MPGFDDDTIIITCVQRFDSKSGHLQLISAFRQVSEKIGNAFLLLVGGPTYSDAIASVRRHYFAHAQSLVSHLGLSARVLFAGNVDYYSLGTVYDASDIVVMLSQMECFGLAVSEAMYKGLPVVVTNVGGLAYQVAPGRTGFVVPVGDVAATAQALIALCESSALRHRMGDSAKEVFAASFRPDRVREEYVQLYQGLMSQRTGVNYRTLYNVLR